MASLGSLDLGIVHDEDRTKDAQLFQQPLPGSDSTSSIILDLFGVSGTLRITGTKIGNAISDINTFVSALDALVAGTQTRIVYTSDSGRTYNVYIQTATYKINEGAPTSVDYDISLIEGA